MFNIRIVEKYCSFSENIKLLLITNLYLDLGQPIPKYILLKIDINAIKNYSVTYLNIMDFMINK